MISRYTTGALKDANNLNPHQLDFAVGVGVGVGMAQSPWPPVN